MDIVTIVKKYIDNCSEREPIFVKDVKVPTECKNARNIAFCRLEKENKIRRYRKGLYFKPKITVFGELGIDTQQLISREYIRENDNIYGYITGPVLWNSWGLTTQVPNRTWIATNNTKKTTEKKALKIKLIKPKAIVNTDNYKLLQLLDTVSQINEIQDVNWEIFLHVLFVKIEELNDEKLKFLINLTQYYNKFVSNFIGALLEETFKNTWKLNQFKHELIKLKRQANLGKRYKLTCKSKLTVADEWGFY